MERYLTTLREPVPPWLAAIVAEHQFRPQDYFSSRIAFYPGSGLDGHLVKVFGSTHSTHCFVYADYGLSDAVIKNAIDDPDDGFRGYHSLMRIDLNENEILPKEWVPHVNREEVRYRQSSTSRLYTYGFVEILERNFYLDDEHGAKRLAVMFLGADGIAAYDALFCQPPSNAPFALLLQDHGFGGNYTNFGRGGLLEKIGIRSNTYPELFMCADNTEIWRNYELIPGHNLSMGAARQVRRLYVRG